MKSLFHFFKFTLGLESAHSQVTERELELLLRYSHDARTICEIGCYEGSTRLLGSMRFYSEDLPKIPGVTECDGVDSFVILQCR